MKTCEDPMILSQESIIGVRINNPRGSECDIQLSGSTFHVVEAWDSFLFLPKNSPKKQKPNNIKSEELDIHNWSCGETPLAHWKTTSPSSFTSQVPNDPPQTLSYSCRLAHAGLGYFDPHRFACGNGWNYSPHKKWMVKEYLQNVQEYVKCKTRFYVAIIFWGFFSRGTKVFPTDGLRATDHDQWLHKATSTGSWGRQSQTSTGAVSTDLGIQ